MSNRAVCTADGESSRLRCLHPPNGTSSSQKIRRTRKAPDFYSPETPSSKTETKSKKVDSDENDSWKPESDSDEEVESASESERSTGRHRTGPRRRLNTVQKGGPSPDPTEPLLLDTPNDSSGNSDIDEKSMKKDEAPQKKIKGVRELQNLLDGHAQVHKESRYRRLASRRDRRGPGISESTWSNASSSKALEEKVPEADPDPDPKPDPLLKVSSSDLDPEGDLNGEGQSSKQSGSFQNGSLTTKSKYESNGGGGLRAKRQRLDLSNSFGNDKVRENGQRRNSFPQVKTTDFKLPRLPMIKYGDYWYRARIKKEDRESIYVEFTGFEDSPLKPFWIRKDSESVFKGSYSGKDWKYLGEGSWEPRPRKLIAKKSNGRRRKNGRKRRALPCVAESVATAQGSKIGNFNDVLINADSDVEFTKSASAVLGRENGGDCSSPKLTLNEHQSRYRASSSTLVIDPSLPESSLDPRSAPEQDKSLDQEGSQSRTAQEKTNPSTESFPDQGSTRQVIESPMHGEGVKPGPNDDNSPLSRTGASPMNNEEDTEKPVEDQHNSNQALNNNNSSSMGADPSDERVVQQRCRRKQTPMTNFRRLRSEDDPTRRPNELRRSARLGWKTPWKTNFKDDSSSEAECGDESLQNANSNRRSLHSGRNGGAKYLNQAEVVSQGRNGVPTPRRCGYQTRSKRPRRSNRSKDDFDLEDESFDLPNGPSDDLRQYGSQVLDGMEVFSLGVNAFAQIRKYLPYYNSHIADARLPSFVELMEKLDGVKAEQLTTTTTTNTSSVLQSKSKDGLRIGKQQLENNLPPPPPPGPTLLDSSEIQP